MQNMPKMDELKVRWDDNTYTSVHTKVSSKKLPQ